jgi:hypothetical protein
MVYATVDAFEIEDCPRFYALSYTWDHPVERDGANGFHGDFLPSCGLLIVDIEALLSD